MYENEETYLRMAVFTTARTTAFMPALSPPEVKTAIFILLCFVVEVVVVVVVEADDAGGGADVDIA